MSGAHAGPPAIGFPLAPALALALALASCGRGSGGTGAGGGGGAGGAGGAPPCSSEVAPLFTLRVGGPEGELPLDLTLAVSWSVGDEPIVILADPATFGDSSSNVICARVAHIEGEGGGSSAAMVATSGSGGEGGGSELEDLLCEVWTSGPTAIVLEAAGHVPVKETLVPETIDECERPVPSEVTITLVLEEEEEP